MATIDKYIYTLITIRNNLLVQPLEKLDIRRLDSKKEDGSLSLRKARNEVVRVSKRKMFIYSRRTIFIFGTILDVSCVFLGCGARNAHDTKRAETLSWNRNEVWSLESALPEKREEGREESREKHRSARMRRDCIAELDDWIVRERGSTRFPVPDVSRKAAGIFARLIPESSFPNWCSK